MNLDKPFLKPAQNTENLLNSRFGNDPITENTPNQRTESMFGNKDAKKKALKAKLQEYMAKVKKPRVDQETVKQQPPLIKNRLQPIQPVTSRITGLTTPKSIEKQKSELNAMMDNLKSMLKERMAKKSEPTVYEIVNGGPNEENLQSVVPNSPESVLGDTNSGGEVIGDTDEQLVPSLESRDTLESTQPAADWSSSLGQIVSASSNPNEVFFMASGIKLPMKIVKQEDGTLDLSLDLEKLCACKNTTCPKNPAVIEETVGAILEKEAEIEDQLNIENTIMDGSKRHKSELSKRSPDMSKYPNPNLDNVLNEINDFGKKIKHSFSKTVNEVQKDIDQTNNAIVKGIRTDKISDIPKINPKNYLDKEYFKLKNLINQDGTFDTNLQQLLNEENAINLPLLEKEKFLLQNLRNNIPKSNDILTSQQSLKNPTYFLENNLKTFNNNLDKLQETYHLGEINSLKKQLDDLDNQVEKFEENNEKMLVKEGNKFFAGQRNDIVDKEVNIIKRILSWMSSLTTALQS
ncbi:uncharacterized protein LOC115891068 [Sitophilus oryzae]|uniref:Uncharacterized protein LOC115891068 n=1 Tax=Sitophilus oryzae TaxID=7048 RepID=A0A6J2YWU4_SITOR|nr:uncharacterized protein LOC115891068 [Sitophilus oryzae]